MTDPRPIEPTGPTAMSDSMSVEELIDYLRQLAAEDAMIYCHPWPQVCKALSDAAEALAARQEARQPSLVGREEVKTAITNHVRHYKSRRYTAKHGHYSVYHWSGLDEATDAILALLNQGGGEGRQTNGEKHCAGPQAVQHRRKPVAWRCKDYADGWIYYTQESAAAAYRAETGCLMEPLFTHPAESDAAVAAGSPACAGKDARDEPNPLTKAESRGTGE